MKNILSTLAVSLGLFAGALHAQNMMVANPSGFNDYKSTFVNPAIMPFHRTHVAAGAKVFHLGFVEGESSPFRQGFASMILPYGLGESTSLGLQGQYFGTPLYSQSNISFLFAHKLGRVSSLGLRFNLFSKAYDQAGFDLVDANDPVFANNTSLWSASVGVGATFFPFPNLALGVGVDHLNRANVSLTNDDVFQPLKGFAGTTLHLNYLEVSVSTIYEDGEFLPLTSIGTNLQDVGFMSFGYNERAFEAIGQLRVSGPLSVNYAYEHTLFAGDRIGGGSHQFTLIHDMDYHRGRLPEFVVPPALMLNFEPPGGMAGREPNFHLFLTSDKLQIVEKNLTRVFDPSLTPEALRQLSVYDIGTLDSTQEEIHLPYKKEPVDLKRVPALVEPNLTKQYRDFMTQFAAGDSNGVKTNIVAPREAFLRAAGMREFIENQSGTSNISYLEPLYASSRDSLLATQGLDAFSLKSSESLTTLSDKRTRFQIVPVSITQTPQSWKVLVDDINGSHIREFSGSGMPDAEIDWDWTDANNTLLTPGIYTYYMEWQDDIGNSHHSDKRYIAVQRVRRNIKVEITKQPKSKGVDADEISIILKE
jgi:hypothetical protein